VVYFYEGSKKQSTGSHLFPAWRYRLWAVGFGGTKKIGIIYKIPLLGVGVFVVFGDMGRQPQNGN
jgi:hypothetical protein